MLKLMDAIKTIQFHEMIDDLFVISSVDTEALMRLFYLEFDIRTGASRFEDGFLKVDIVANKSCPLFKYAMRFHCEENRIVRLKDIGGTSDE